MIPAGAFRCAASQAAQGRKRLALCLLLGLGLLLLSGCPKGVKAPVLKTSDPAPVWQRFIEESKAQALADPSKAFSLSAGLHYAGPKNSSRVNIRFWGDLDGASRIDLQTGMGQTLGFWHEDERGFTAFVPDKNTAYLHSDAKRGIAAFGVALPFTLRELGLLLNGRWSGLFPETYLSARAVPGKGFSFAVRQGDQDYTLLLDAQGLPLGMTTGGGDPWKLEFSDYDPAAPRLPKKIVMTREPGEKAVLVIKKLEQLPAAWPERKLKLDLPPDARIEDLGLNSAIEQRGRPHG